MVVRAFKYTDLSDLPSPALDLEAGDEFRFFKSAADRAWGNVCVGVGYEQSIASVKRIEARFFRKQGIGWALAWFEGNELIVPRPK